MEYVCLWGRVSRNCFALVVCDELLHQEEQTAVCRQAWLHVKQWSCQSQAEVQSATPAYSLLPENPFCAESRVQQGHSYRNNMWLNTTACKCVLINTLLLFQTLLNSRDHSLWGSTSFLSLFFFNFPDQLHTSILHYLLIKMQLKCLISILRRRIFLHYIDKLRTQQEHKTCSPESASVFTSSYIFIS